MLDPNYDPFEELEIAKHNIGELIKAINHYSELLKELSDHHNALVKINSGLSHRVKKLEFEVLALKSTKSS